MDREEGSREEFAMVLADRLSGEDAGAEGESGAPIIVEAGRDLLDRWTAVQRDEIEEAQRIHDLSWQQARIAHPALQRAIDVRRRRNIRLVFPLLGEGVFLVPPLWAVTKGEVLIGFALMEEL